MNFRLEFDGSRCDGHGICALRCPERVSLDEWGYASVDPAPLATPRLLARARAAAAACPGRALALRPADPPPARSPAPGAGWPHTGGMGAAGSSA